MAATPSRVDPVFLEFQLAVAGRYSIDRELGRGGMGIVYLARDVQLDRHVAIKLLPPDRAVDDAVRLRFVREARLAAKLSHPNIIPIYAVDEVDGFVFYVMAYVDGETLGERVRARGPMAASEATRVLREVAWALGHAHAQGVVHRDVKPENIMLERGTGRALVTDFGIAAAIGTDESPTVAGTPEYMSPEQALGGELDARSDVYALGATAYFLVAGRTPFVGARAVDVVAQHVATPAPSLATVGATVPRRLAQVIEKCLAKEAAHRPASAYALADQLGAAVEQRREVPAMLRAFVKRDGRVVGVGAFAATYIALGGGAAMAAEFGPLVAVAIVGGTIVSIPLGVMAWGARNLLRRGFTQADVGLAFDHEIEQLREEFHAAGRVERPRISRIAGAFVAGGLVSLIAGIALPLGFGGNGWIGPILASVGGVAALGGAIVRTVLDGRRPQTAVERWRKLWLGRIGNVAFGLAKRLGGRAQAGAATTHRATEMAIGMAADELYAALPKETQRALGDVPKVVARLQKDATELRAALDRMQESLGDVAQSAEADEYTELRQLRDELAERHKQVITALETTRLDLLRLHAGAIKVDGFTTQFDQAGEVSTEVRRLLEARGELERFLRFPSAARETPA
jgi:predicted Ser/Thr protein kinase